MPLGKISLDSILGLNTERNDSSGINSPAWSSMSAWSVENASSGATNPNTLVDCTNIIISRNKQAAARTAFSEVWDFTSTYGADEDFKVTGMYAIPNSTTDSIQFAWINGTSANIANFSTSVNQNMTGVVYIIGGVYFSNTSDPYLLCDFSWNASTFKTKSFNLARFTSSYSNIYIFSSNGTFRTTVPYLQDITSSTYNKFKRVTLPLVKNLRAQLTTSPSDANRWFLSGKFVDIKVLATDQLTSTQVYQGKPSRILTVINTSTSTSIQITFAIDNTNIYIKTGSNPAGLGGVAVYRTQSYSAGDAAPTKFYKVWESSMDNGVTAGSTTTFTDIELTLNDTSILQFSQLYTDLNVETGSGIGGAIISAESAAPPTAIDVAVVNNFTVYGNVMVPPFAPLTMTALPNTDGGDLLQVGSTSVAVTYTPNSTTPPSNSGVIDGTTGTFIGVSKTPNSGNGYNLVIRPQDPNINSTGASAGTFSVPWYAIASKLELVTGTGTTQNIQITPDIAEMFDISKFAATGIIAIISSKTTGNVVALFTYQSFTQVPASGWYLFSNCLAYGVPFSDPTWATTFKTITGKYILYYLPGTAVTALPVYAIGSTATGYGSETGFSLLPTYDKYPDRPFNQTLVGILSSANQNTASVSPAFSPLLGAINFTGVYSQNAGQLLNQCVKTLCDTYNTARAAEDPYAVFDDSATAPVGRIRFESIYSGYNRFSTYTANPLYTSGTGFYDQVTACVHRASGTIVVRFAEPIPSVVGAVTLQNIMQQSVQTVAGLSISKFNKPEEIPIGQNLAPLIIGDPLKPIIKLVNQYNQLFVFKQNEGTYRIDLQGISSGILPQVTISSLLDNTAWLLLPESVQVFEGSVIYFSNKAFVTISSTGQITEMSPTIATELLENYSTIYSNSDTNKVRSWIIAQQRLYCCYFPYVNSDQTSVTYVFNFNTGQWTKWSGEINDITISASGQLTLVESIFKLEETVSDTLQLNTAPIDKDIKYWSVIRQANFQTPSSTQIEDIIPLTDFDISFDSNLSTVTLSNFNTNSVYGNLYYLLMIWKNRVIWFLSETSGFLLTSLISTDIGNSITLQFVDNKGKIAHVKDFTPTHDDFLVASVNTGIYFNKFFIATPRGSTISHFNEVQLYTQEGEDYTNLYIGFNSTADQNEFITKNDGTTFIVTSTGSYVTLNDSIDTIFEPFYPLQKSQYAFRALVPQDSGRGRFIQIALKHNTPNEVFKLNSVVFIYRDLNSTKIKAHA